MPYLDLRRGARTVLPLLIIILSLPFAPAAVAETAAVALAEQKLSVQVGAADRDLWRGSVWIGGSYRIDGDTLFLDFTSASADEQATCDVGANIPKCNMGSGEVIDMRTWRRTNEAAGIMIGQVRVVFDQGETVAADSWSQGSRYQVPEGATRVERVEIAIKPNNAVVEPTSFVLLPQGQPVAAPPPAAEPPGEPAPAPGDATAAQGGTVTCWLLVVAVAAGLGVLLYILFRRRRKKAG